MERLVRFFVERGKAKSYGHPNQENFIGQGFAVA